MRKQRVSLGLVEGRQLAGADWLNEILAEAFRPLEYEHSHRLQMNKRGCALPAFIWSLAARWLYGE